MIFRPRLGWLKDLPDRRDHVYGAPSPLLARLPPRVDLSPSCPPVYDQGHLGSCTANALSASLQFLQKKQRQSAFLPSRLYIYYNERSMEGTIQSDAGAQLRDGIKAVNRWGACKESMWPYEVERFATRPGQDCYEEGLCHQALAYQRVTQNLAQMKGCLAAGFPFVFGFVVFESLLSPKVAKSGEAPMPQSGEQPQGGHAVMAVGYDEARQRFLIRNSWGKRWGRKGYFSLPYAYLTEAGMAADFWTIRLVE